MEPDAPCRHAALTESTPAPPTCCLLADLTEPLALHILTLIGLPDVLRCVSPLNKHFRELSLDASLWQSVCLGDSWSATEQQAVVRVAARRGLQHCDASSVHDENRLSSLLKELRAAPTLRTLSCPASFSLWPTHLDAFTAALRNATSDVEHSTVLAERLIDLLMPFETALETFDSSVWSAVEGAKNVGLQTLLLELVQASSDIVEARPMEKRRVRSSLELLKLLHSKFPRQFAKLPGDAPGVVDTLLRATKQHATSRRIQIASLQLLSECVFPEVVRSQRGHGHRSLSLAGPASFTLMKRKIARLGEISTAEAVKQEVVRTALSSLRNYLDHGLDGATSYEADGDDAVPDGDGSVLFVEGCGAACAISVLCLCVDWGNTRRFVAAERCKLIEGLVPTGNAVPTDVEGCIAMLTSLNAGGDLTPPQLGQLAHDYLLFQRDFCQLLHLMIEQDNAHPAFIDSTLRLLFDAVNNEKATPRVLQSVNIVLALRGDQIQVPDALLAELTGRTNIESPQLALLHSLFSSILRKCIASGEGVEYCPSAAHGLLKSCAPEQQIVAFASFWLELRYGVEQQIDEMLLLQSALLRDGLFKLAGLAVTAAADLSMSHPAHKALVAAEEAEPYRYRDGDSSLLRECEVHSRFTRLVRVLLYNFEQPPLVRSLVTSSLSAVCLAIQTLPEDSPDMGAEGEPCALSHYANALSWTRALDDFGISVGLPAALVRLLYMKEDVCIFALNQFLSIFVASEMSPLNEKQERAAAAALAAASTAGLVSDLAWLVGEHIGDFNRKTSGELHAVAQHDLPFLTS